MTFWNNKVIKRLKRLVFDQWLCFVGGSGRKETGWIDGTQGMFNLMVNSWSESSLSNQQYFPQYFSLEKFLYLLAKQNSNWSYFYISGCCLSVSLVYSHHHELLKLTFTKVQSLNFFISTLHLLENSFISMAPNIICLLITPKFIFSG